MSKHTPGPWVQFVQRDGTGKIELIVIMPAGRPGDVASVAVDSPTDEANAAFIVRACNAHDELVEALKHAQSVLHDLVREPKHSIQVAYAQCIEAETKARAALRKSEGA